VALCHAAWGQQDNGNHFQMSWSAPFSVFKGDQDGHKEFLVYDKVATAPAHDKLKCFEAVGDNDFRLVWEKQYARLTPDEGHGLTVTDLDNDGRDEVLVATENVIYIYEWDGSTFESGGGLPQQPTLVLQPPLNNLGRALIRQPWVTNLDTDPEPELFLGYFGRAGLYMAIASLPNRDLSNPDWKFEFADDFPDWRVGGICIADFDGNGKVDIWSSHFDDQPATRVYENDGQDNYVIKFTTQPSDLIMQPSFDSTIANAIFYDFDRDGIGELLICDSHGKVFVITKAASNNFTNFGPTAWTYILRMPGVENNGFVRSGFLGDLDQDDKPDIYYNDFTAEAVLDLEYQGGPITSPSSWIPYQIYKGHKLVYGYIYPAGDLDGDGKGEIVIAGNGDPVANLQIIENQDAPTSVAGKVSDLPGRYVLRQNYPNPFNPTTQISYELAQSGHVRLEVSSILGQKVATLVDEYQTAGSYRVHFDGGNLAAGVYLYQITAGSFTERKKMVLAK